MYYFFESMPLWMYTVCGLGCAGILIWGKIDTKAKKPGHPGQPFLTSAIVTTLLLVIHRFVFTFSTSLFLQKVSDVVVALSIIVSTILLFVDATLSVKRGYGNGTVKELWSTLGVCFSIIAVLIIFLFIVVNKD